MIAPRTAGIHHLTLRSTDLARSRAFYGNTLGLPIVIETPEFKARFNKFRYPAFSYTYLGYNLRLPMFQDRRVRQAITSASSRSSMRGNSR